MASALSDLSTTANSNGTKLGQQMAENATPPSAVNNAVRGWQAYTKQWMADNDGTVAASGTTTITATLNQGFTAFGTGDGQIKNGETIALKMPSASTAATTLNVNALGAKAIRQQGDFPVTVGDWAANATIKLRYDTAYNSAAGAWVLLTSTPNATTTAAGTIATLTSTDAGSAVGPTIDLFRDSASPSASDSIGSLYLSGRTSTGVAVQYGVLSGQITVPTNGSERGTVILSARGTASINLNGSTSVVQIDGRIDSLTGQFSFPATQNASSNANTLDDYEEGTFTPGLSFGGGTTGMTFAGRSAAYTKTGDQVFCFGFENLSAKGSSTGSAAITGLPFSINSSYNAPAVLSGWSNLTTTTMLIGQGGGSTTTISLQTTGTTVASVTEANFNNNTAFNFSVVFKV